MSNICINVEMLAGTEVSDAIKDAKALAEKLDVAYVSFSFNKINFSIGKNAVIEDVLTDWNKRISDPTLKYGIIHR